MPGYDVVARLGLLTALVGMPFAASAADADKDAEGTPTAEQVRFFEAKVRPVLVENCVKCHGPKTQKSHLRLDSRAAAVAGGEQGPAVVPGKPDESLLVTAVRHDDDLKMPPSKKLPADVVADLSRWVSMGAPWPGQAEEATAAPSAVRRGPMTVTQKDREHWAFRPVARPAAPAVKDQGWVRNPVDAFVLAGLEARGLRPNPEADKRALIRRVTYDLTGLPPTPEEVRAFVNDDAPDAYERLVDRLLASPHYGEAWGRHWLDLVRFAETNSYERDDPKPNAWRYRDYVVRALNRDKPYDRFVREQIAGDELPDGGLEGVIATGYYRLGIWDDEPTDLEQARFDSLDDVVATTSQVFLGLTVDCARCHDHKIDPIPQADYYRLLSFFRNVNHYRNGGPTDEAPAFETAAAKAEYEARVRDLARRREAVQAKVEAIENEYLKKSPGGDAGLRRADVEGLRYRFYRDTWDRLPDFDALKPEESGDLPAGRFDLTPRTRDDAFGFVFEGTLVVPASGEYTFTLDADDGARLTVGGLDLTHDGGPAKTAVATLPEGRLPVRLDYFQRSAKFGLAVTWSGPGVPRRPLSADPSPTGRRQRAADLARLVSTKGKPVLGDARWAQYMALQVTLRALRTERPKGDAALCVTEAGPVAPETFVMLRGNPHVPGPKVEPAFLTVLDAPAPVIPPPVKGARTTGRRTALADWLTSPSNPLPARVTANRVWQFHFGRGLVRSPNNFGTQGDKPTHPALLDWLASELVSGGWRLKPLHKLILTSNAYRMASSPSAEGLAKDATNDALWRFDPRRLTAEEIRDSVLAMTGSLNPSMHGPGVYPEIPAEVMAGQSVPGKGWGKSSPAEQARRSVYVHVKRSLIMPILEGFDQAETDRSTPVRFSTTQPTQALAMLNGKFLNAQAARLAARLCREAGTDADDRVRLALRLTTGREPTEAETRRGVGLMNDLVGRDGMSPDEALKAFGLVVLNLNEFLYLD